MAAPFGETGLPAGHRRAGRQARASLFVSSPLARLSRYASAHSNHRSVAPVRHAHFPPCFRRDSSTSLVEWNSSAIKRNLLVEPFFGFGLGGEILLDAPVLPINFPSPGAEVALQFIAVIENAVR